jgi:cytochrome P450
MMFQLILKIRDRQFSPYEFLPFGGGDRRCLGVGLAQYELKLALATILARFKLKLIDPKPLKPIRYGVAMIPPNELKIAVVGMRK